MLNLVSLDFQAPVYQIPLETLPVVIGRGPDADVRIDHDSVGREHCRIEHVDGEWVVSDLETVHGTFIEGTRIRRAILRPGCQLAVGMLTFLVQSVREEDSRAVLEEAVLGRAA
jgi:pSer/pThr/pTyr-binding forkhead associated (FHA) protein